MIRKTFICYWYFQGWQFFSLGFHIDLATPNVELHLPFGFLRAGRSSWVDPGSAGFNWSTGWTWGPCTYGWAEIL